MVWVASGWWNLDVTFFPWPPSPPWPHSPTSFSDRCVPQASPLPKSQGSWVCAGPLPIPLISSSGSVSTWLLRGQWDIVGRKRCDLPSTDLVAFWYPGKPPKFSESMSLVSEIGVVENHRIPAGRQQGSEGAHAQGWLVLGETGHMSHSLPSPNTNAKPAPGSRSVQPSQFSPSHHCSPDPGCRHLSPHGAASIHSSSQPQHSSAVFSTWIRLCLTPS